jgi:F0F1-type ATP synthase assembly protein I
LLDNEEAYFFHDLTSYKKIFRENIPDIDDLTIFHLKEAMQAFMVGCRLSSGVMLGVALEYSLSDQFRNSLLFFLPLTIIIGFVPVVLKKGGTGGS